MTESIAAARHTDTGPITHDPTVRFRRIAGAVALPLGLAFQLASNTIYAVVSTESGMSDTGSGAEALAFYARYPDALTAATLLAATGVLVMIPGLLAGLRVIRPYRPRLALWSVALMVAGYVCYLGLVLGSVDAQALAPLAAAHPELALGGVLDAAQPGPAWPFGLLFVVGNIIGTALLGLAVILSRGLPWWAGALILGWPVGHVLNVFAGLGEWFAVGGGALEIAGLIVLALIALRTSDREWAAHG